MSYFDTTYFPLFTTIYQCISIAERLKCVFVKGDFFSWPIMTPCHVCCLAWIMEFVIWGHDTLTYNYEIFNKSAKKLKNP